MYTVPGLARLCAALCGEFFFSIRAEEEDPEYPLHTAS